MEPKTRRSLTITAVWVTWFVGSQAILMGWAAAFYPSPVGKPRLAPYIFWSIGFVFLAATLLLMWKVQRLSKESNVVLFVFGYLIVGVEVAFTATGIIELVRYIL
jgi:hypothetical protein